MGMLRPIACVAIAACGRAGFDTQPIDAPVDTPDAAPSQLVAMTTAANVTMQVLDVTIPQVVDGDLLIVAFASHDGTAVTDVRTAAGTALIAGPRAEMASTASELWYQAGAAPTTKITITMAAKANFDVWVAEFSRVANAPPAMMAMGCLEYPPLVVTAPAAAQPGQLVFGVTMLAFPAFLSTIDPPFTPLTPLTGNGAAYYIAPATGSYGPAWQVGMGAGMAAMTCASTAVFSPL